MQLDTLFEIVCASHLTVYVDSPFRERGGIMLVSLGGALKTSVLEVLEHYHPKALIQTDITVQALSRVRDQMAAGIVSTMVFTDFQKLYERNPGVSANVEGAIRAMVAEGFSSLAFEDQRINRRRARSMVLAAITPGFEAKRFDGWMESGFARRFMWCHYSLADPELITDAIVRQRPIDFGAGVIPVPRGKSIPFDVSPREAQRLRDLLRFQYGDAIPLSLLAKILAVLKWARRANGRAKREPWEVIEDFSTSLTKEGAPVDVRQK